MYPHANDDEPSGRPGGKTVGQAARELGVAAHVLRHWEDEGVLVPARDGLGHRRYRDTDLALAAEVQRAQRAGLSLAQIRQFLAADPSQRAALFAAHREMLLLESARLGQAAAA
ncbi:MerR family transcriptional regulator [Enemella dayhoffiae]|uniref:MerR family transcriptional regulator n=1 Tax=Enemella dayhoffiae TaxID=2016507 RepID=A0A255HBD6_9ACTN|nr:helix-turn-helix domain-containing protein [Enemella dayhoffiae]OYO25280.1 MerR family transcriptional regulator [Enemella dayhoffiae]